MELHVIKWQLRAEADRIILKKKKKLTEPKFTFFLLDMKGHWIWIILEHGSC